MAHGLSATKSLAMSANVSQAPKYDPPIALLALMLGGAFWGLAWWPLKYFGQQGLDGHAIALTAYALVSLVSLPLIWRERHAWRGEWRLLLLIAVLFGIANFLFTWSLMVGSVVRSMLLFFLLPAWGVIGGKLFLSEQLGPRRLLAVALSLIGVFTIVGGFDVFDAPLSLADAAAFIAGIAYTGAGITNRKAFEIPMVSRTLVAFVGCTSVALLGLVIHVPTIPMMSVSDWSLLALYAFVWLIGGTLLTTYGVTYVPASRAAVMQVLELIVAMISAILIGGELLSIGEIVGAVMILSATFLKALTAKPEAEDS